MIFPMWVKRLAGFFVMLTILSIFWSLAYFSTNYLYRTLDVHLHGWLQQIITSVLGILFLFIVMLIATRFNKKFGKKHDRYFQPITDAMQQIATGDFNVSLDKMRGHERPNDPFGKIIDNINYMAKELGEVEEMRQEFISNVSHEIQSPLTSISGFARALKNDQLTKQERARYVTIIETESKRLSNISDNLLKLTYLEAGKHDFYLEKYRLDQQLQQIVLACEPQWQAKNIEMKLEMETTFLNADEELMNQVWFNLLTNAIKFTNTDGKITIEIAKKEQTMTVSIADTGIGITEEEKFHLFERFYKADKSRSRDRSGSGLGLSIVKKILTLHDATIRVESSETGTTFYIQFTNDSE